MMKKNLTVIPVLLFVSLFLFSFWIITAEAGDLQEGVWKQYLSAKESAALTQMAAQQAKELEAGETSAEADPKAMLSMMRKGFEQFATESVELLASVKMEPFDSNGVKGIWFKPKRAAENRVLLYFHGGGYVVGSPKTATAVAGYLAHQAGILCFSLDYPLAPESPYPAALENALKAYRMLLGKGFKPENIVLGGDSAGGGLTLAVLLNIRDKGLPMPAGAYLLSPWTDLSNRFASHEIKKDVDILITADFLGTLASLYAKGEDLKNPLISPAFADLRGLPPLLIHVGSHETLLDDTLTVVRNAAMADVPVKLTVWPGYFHVFQMFSERFEGGRRALQDGAVFFKEVMQKTLLRPAGTGK